MILAALLACVPEAVEPDKPARDTGGETGEEPDDLAEDDARVRGLTGLPEGESPCAEPQLVRVLDVVDGDTIHVAPEGETWWTSTRLIGVDTPEIAHEDPAECFGNDAWEYSTGALKGKLVWLTFDAECTDVYDRSLAYAFRGDDEAGFFNRSLVRNGYATVLTIPPNDTYAELFQADARAARDEGAGLWAACDR